MDPEKIYADTGGEGLPWWAAGKRRPRPDVPIIDETDETVIPPPPGPEHGFRSRKAEGPYPGAPPPYRSTWDQDVANFFAGGGYSDDEIAAAAKAAKAARDEYDAYFRQAVDRERSRQRRETDEARKRAQELHNRATAHNRAKAAGLGDYTWIAAAFASVPRERRKALYRALSMALHPDQGGDDAGMIALNAAYERAT
jgi:hypothetical protein